MGAGAILICLVVGITDGDTLTARCDDKTHKVRLAQIDAPERGKPFFKRSKQSLSELCYHKQATLLVTGKSYERIVAAVDCEGRSASVEQVKRGMAWVWGRYANNAHSLYDAQETARQAKRGMWRFNNKEGI